MQSEGRGEFGPKPLINNHTVLEALGKQVIATGQIFRRTSAWVCPACVNQNSGVEFRPDTTPCVAQQARSLLVWGLDEYGADAISLVDFTVQFLDAGEWKCARNLVRMSVVFMVPRSAS